MTRPFLPLMANLAPLDLALDGTKKPSENGISNLFYNRPAAVISAMKSPAKPCKSTYASLRETAITLDSSAAYIVTQKGQRIALGESFVESCAGSVSMARVIGAEVDQIVVAKEIKIPGKSAVSKTISAKERAVATAIDLAHEAKSPYAPLGVLVFEDSIVELLPVAAGHLGHVLADGLVKNNISHRMLVAANTMREVSFQLNLAHQAGISHRDVALKNIFFSSHGDLALADFGLAVKSHTLTEASSSLVYAAPEALYRGNGGCVEPYNGPAADMWSLGVVLATLIVGRMPFAADVHDLSASQSYSAVAEQQSLWQQSMKRLNPWLIKGALGPRPTLSTKNHESFVSALMQVGGPLGAITLSLLQPSAKNRPTAASVFAAAGGQTANHKDSDQSLSGSHQRRLSTSFWKKLQKVTGRVTQQTHLASPGAFLDTEKSLATVLSRISTETAVQVEQTRMFGVSSDLTRPDPLLHDFVKPPALIRRHTTGDMSSLFNPDHDIEWGHIMKELSFWRNFNA